MTLIYKDLAAGYAPVILRAGQSVELAPRITQLRRRGGIDSLPS
jgi:hypothetical protein